jgi:hypothetical protein
MATAELTIYFDDFVTTAGTIYFTIEVNAVSATSIPLSCSPEHLNITINAISSFTEPPVFGGSVTVYPSAALSLQNVIDDIETMIVSGVVDRELESNFRPLLFTYNIFNS